MNIPTINLARTGTNIVMLRKAAGLTVHDLQIIFRESRHYWCSS